MKHSKKAIEQKLREPQICALRDESCAGRMTIHRAVMYAGRRIHEPWAYLWLCAKHHGVDQYQDQPRPSESRCRAIAIANATPQQLAKYPKLTK